MGSSEGTKEIIKIEEGGGGPESQKTLWHWKQFGSWGQGVMVAIVRWWETLHGCLVDRVQKPQIKECWGEVRKNKSSEET